MDMNEHNPSEAREHQGGDRPNNGKPRHNHRHRPHHGKKNSAVAAPNEAVNVVESNTAAVTEGVPSGPKPQSTNQPKQHPKQSSGKGANQPKENHTKAGKSEGPSRPAAPKHQQRVPHPMRHAQQPDLPAMDNLLIEDCPEEVTDLAGYDFDQAEVDRILERDIFEHQDKKTIPDVIPDGKTVIVGVRFRTGGKTYFFTPGELTCAAGQYAVVETARGLEFGEIYIPNHMVDNSMVVPPLRPVVRLATEEDIRQNELNHQREEEAYRIGVEKITAHKLDMKLVSVQYTFDNSKLLFYFTSAGRVDFRDLVKDLAGVFHIRIELRQIGIRDEARMLGGLGACGRPLCCSSFLSDFGQVSMKMAKEQNLSLNSNKISGCCGRLMCCLRYEHETYLEEIRRTPSPGTFVNTPDGPGVVTESFPLQAQVKVSLKNQPDSAPKKYHRADVTTQAGGRGHDRRTDNTSEPATIEGVATETAEPDSDE